MCLLDNCHFWISLVNVGGWGLGPDILPDCALVAIWDIHSTEVVVVLLEGTAVKGD